MLQVQTLMSRNVQLSAEDISIEIDDKIGSYLKKGQVIE